MKDSIKDLFNLQIQAELEAAYQYLEFSNFFDSRHLDGYANYYRIEAKEEIDEAMLIYDYLSKIGTKVDLLVIKAPQNTYKDIAEVLDAGLKYQNDLAKRIDKIFETTQTEKDFASKIFTKWFVQNELEKKLRAQNMIDEYKLYPNNLYDLNTKYKERKQERI